MEDQENYNYGFNQRSDFIQKNYALKSANTERMLGV